MYKKIGIGILFTMLWGSGSVAVKFGLHSADALILATVRFIGTGLLFGPYYFFVKKERFWPKKAEWKSILIYGFLSSTLMLGTFFAAIPYSSAGISMLFLAVGPLLIALFSSIFLKRKLSRFEVIGMLVSFTGLIVASASALPTASIKPIGLILLIVYILAYALSSVYFSQLKLDLSNAVFNIWQVFIGGVLLLPFCLVSGQYHIQKWDTNLFLTLFWLILVLSYIANQLWLYLLDLDPVSAGNWLYLTPVFGYAYGYFLLGEEITLYAVAGIVLVLVGLAISKKNSAPAK
jgi:probable blue pigment (indigoidine) exporter